MRRPGGFGAAPPPLRKEVAAVQPTPKLECVVTDLDNSLLDDQKQVSPRDLAVIHALKRQGILFFVVTGRPFPFARQVVRSIGFDLPVCCCNGGHIYDYAAGQTLYARPIPAPVALRVYRHLMEHGVPFILFTPQGTVFRDRTMKRCQYWQHWNSCAPACDQVSFHFVDDPGFDPAQTQVIKFSISYVDEAVRRGILEELGPQAGAVSCVFSEAGVLDVNAAGVNKGEGVRQLALRFGFDPARTLALGDNFNDVEMLRLCGVPVAPQNAEQSLRAAARFVTADHSDSPLTCAIQALYPALL